MYILYGPERYFVRRALATLKGRLISTPALESLLYRALGATEIDEAKLVDLAQTTPFFGERQLIVVREAERFRLAEEGPLVQYVKDPAPFSCVAFVAGQTFPKGEVFRVVRERCPEGCLEFPRLRRSGLFRWILRIAKEKDLRYPLERPFLEDIVSAVGTDLDALENQIEKLALFSQDPGERALHDPLPIVGSPASPEEGYRLTDALLAARWDSSVQLLQQFLDQGLPPLIILSRISREMRRLWQIKSTLDRKEDVEDACKACGIPYFKKDLYTDAARRCTWDAMRKVFFALEQTDRSLKSSRLSAQLHLDDLCGQILLALGHGGPHREDGSRRRPRR